MSFPRYGQYRESGHHWLTIPSHWELKSLSQCGKFLKGRGGSKEDIADDGVPCIRYGDLYTTHEFFIEATRTRIAESARESYTQIQYGDVLFAASGETFEDIGRSAVNLVTGEVRCGGDIVILRPAAAMNLRFLGYAADSLSARQQKASYGRGTTVKHIYPEQLSAVVIAVPPPDEQTAIAAFLDREIAKIDALVAEQERLIELLKEKRHAAIAHVVMRGLSDNVPKARSPIAWLREVPVHWDLRRLRHLSPSITVGIVVNPSTYVASEGLPFVFGGDIREGVVDWRNARRIDPAVSAQQVKTVLRTGDLLTVRVGAPGVTTVVPSECEGGNCASVMLLRGGEFSSEWLCYVMNSPVVRYQVGVVQYGAAQEQFNISHAVDFWVPVPPRREQDRMVEYLQRMTEKIDALIVHAGVAIVALCERRSALITAAVTGQIDVRGLVNPEAA